MNSDYSNKPYVIIDLGSGRFTLKNEGHEKYNEVINPILGKYLGYAPPLGGLNIKKLGGKASDDKVDDVLVIYTKKIQGTNDRYISSFIPSATVYAKPKSGKGLHRDVKETAGMAPAVYSVESDELISLESIPDDDKFMIRIKSYGNILRGQRFYKGRHPELEERIIKYLESLSSENTEADDIYYQGSIQSEFTSSDKKDVNNSSNEPEFSEGATGRQVKKKISVSKYALHKANHQCESDSAHSTFENKNGLPYMEGHHLIPCTPSNVTRFWKKYGVNIDCPENIVCLCPTCHRQIHYGSKDARSTILKNLYDKRIKILKDLGIEIELEELNSFYR